MSLCDSCRYQYYVEQLKPCIIRRDDCEFYEKEEIVKMRNATPEEQKSTDNYIKSISKPTGVDFLDLEQEPKTGHWEWVQYDYNPKIGNWHCSECRCIVVECVGKEDKSGIPLYKYCPQCGIKMKSQESEDV